MEKKKNTIPVLLLLLTISTTATDSYYTQTTEASHPKEKTTTLHFFFHDTLSGQNPSAVLIINPTNKTKSLFNGLYAVDDPLTVGPDLKSEKIGNAKGMWVSLGGKETTLELVMYTDFGFTKGKLKGSSITVFSRNPVMETERELAVVGGRGRFRLARGVAMLKTVKLDGGSGDAVVEYNVTPRDVGSWSGLILIQGAVRGAYGTICF